MAKAQDDARKRAEEAAKTEKEKRSQERTEEAQKIRVSFYNALL